MSKAIMKNKTVPFSMSDVMWLENLMKAKGMSFSGAVRHCISSTRGSNHEENRLSIIEKKIDNLPAILSELFEDTDDIEAGAAS